MQILREGRVPTAQGGAEKHEWWMHSEFTCGRCGCHFRLDGAEDSGMVMGAHARRSLVRCPDPNCRGEIPVVD